MAKFRDSTVLDNGPGRLELRAVPVEKPAEAPAARSVRDDGVVDRSIGDILAELRNLTAEQVEKVLDQQRATGVRFGEAAVALGLASREDVLFALSQQFHYPYQPQERRIENSELVTLNEPFSVRAEGFRALRSQLTMRLFSDPLVRRAVAVISPDSGDGKTYCAANLAVVLAQLGGRTLLVDADLRNPRIHDVFQLENRSGLSSILSGRAGDQVIQQVASVPSLFVLPVGVTPPNPLELIERPAFGLLMKELAAKFDHVIVDTAAASRGSDASIVAARCGAAVIIARRNKSRVHAMDDLAASLQGGGARLAGVVYNEF